MKQYIEVIQNRIKTRILLNDIYYAEVIRKCCQIHTMSSVIQTYLTMGKLAEQLNYNAFLQCHRSYIVNLNHVNALRGNEFVLTNGERVLVSRPMKNAAQRAYGTFVKNHSADGATYTEAREIKLFFASSDSVLEDDLNELAAFVSELNNRYAQQSVYFSLYIGGEGERAEDLEAAGECNIFYLIYQDKPSGRAGEELEAALGAAVKPKLALYHKQTGEAPATPALSSVFNYYSSPYTHIDTVKLNIVLQLKSLGIENAGIDIGESSLMLAGKSLMSMDNIPVIRNSKDFTDMKNERALLEKEYRARKEEALNNPENNEIMTEYSRVSDKKNKLEEAIHALQKDILAMETMFLEKADAGYISPRLARARLLYEGGDLAGAKRLLDLDELEHEDSRYGELQEVIQGKLMAKVNEYLYLADMLKTDINNAERYTHIKRAYTQAISIEEGFNLDDRAATWKYTTYLYDHNLFTDALEYTLRYLRWYEYRYGDGGGRDIRIAEVYNRLTRCYKELLNYKEALTYSARARAIIEALASEEPKAYEHALAVNLYHRGLIHYDMSDFPEARENMSKAIEIYERLVRENPLYENELADLYTALAILLMVNKFYEESRLLCDKAGALYGGYAYGDPVINKVYQSVVYGHKATSYGMEARYDESEENMLKSLAIQEAHLYTNPAHLESYLGTTYFNLHTLYQLMKNFDKAEQMLDKSIAIRKRLAAQYPLRYERSLANALQHKGGLLYELKRYPEAEPLFVEGHEIMQKIYSTNPEAGAPKMGTSHFFLGRLYRDTGRTNEARVHFEKAIEIHEKLVEKSPAAYTGELEKCRLALAGVIEKKLPG